jgi:hypothetical protein
MLSAATTALSSYEKLEAFWFVSKFDRNYGEGTFQPLYDYPALFQAKAYILNQPYDQLVKYLDVPAFWRGDLFYIQNVVTALEFGDPSYTPAPTYTPVPPTVAPPLVGDFDTDGDVDFKDFLAFLPHFGDSGTTVYDLVTNSLVNIFDFNQLLASFTIMPPPSSTPAPSPTPDQTGQSPFVSHTLPGRIEMEDFDNGGEGVAYHDTTTNNEGNASYRSGTGVDIETTGDSSGNYNLGWTAVGEWLEYTVTVSQTKTYSISVRAAQETAGATLHLTVDGQALGSTLTVPATGGWQTYQNLTTSAALTSGTHVIRLTIDSLASNGFGPNLNYLELN